MISLIADRVWLLALILFAVRAVDAKEEDSGFPRDVLKGIEAMKPLAVDGFQVVQSQGRLLLVSTNAHYVVIGRILDLWNGLEVHSVADVARTERIPLAHLGLSARQLGGVSVGKNESREAVTVFLDPASVQSQQILPPLRELAGTHRVDLVFVPALAERASVARALICHPDVVAPFFNNTRVPEPQPEGDPCGVAELQRARVTVQLLGIHTLPFSIAPNGATLAGVPKEYAQFIASNQE